MKTKQRLVVECDEEFTNEFKRLCIVKAVTQGTTLKNVIIEYLKKWIEE